MKYTNQEFIQNHFLLLFFLFLVFFPPLDLPRLRRALVFALLFFTRPLRECAALADLWTLCAGFAEARALLPCRRLDEREDLELLAPLFAAEADLLEETFERLCDLCAEAFGLRAVLFLDEAL